MAEDLPDISQNLDDPLPQVDPNSALVPYRMSRTDPGGQPVVTTGYGPRARPPIQPPAGFGGGVGMPSLDQIYQAAFSKLPVDEAIKAVEAATRYQAQRGYQQDLQSGMNAAQALSKWGPMLFRQATGLPEAIERTVAPPISPQQMIQNRLNQAKFDAAQAANKAKADAATAKAQAPTIHYNNTTGEVLQVSPDGTTKVLREGKEKPQRLEPPSEDERDARFEWRKAVEERNSIEKTENPKSKSGKQKIDNAQKKVDEAKAKVEEFGKQSTSPFHTDVAAPAPVPNSTQTQPQSPFKEGQIVKNKKDGKRYKIVNGTPIELKD